MRMIRKIIVIHGLEYFIEFNIWNDKTTGRHKFFINIRSNITNTQRHVNISYAHFGQSILYPNSIGGENLVGRFDGELIRLNSKEVKRKVLDYFTNGYQKSY